jgi:hypothetical protein
MLYAAPFDLIFDPLQYGGNIQRRDTTKYCQVDKNDRNSFFSRVVETFD